MNVLMVDDQKIIVDSLKRGIHWTSYKVEQVYTACSAMEAKLILNNFQIDVLISDIEMPEENGLELCRWAKEQFPELECIFLTSHADFSYAKEAISIGSFEYILQPVRYEEVEEALLRVWERVKEKKSMHSVLQTRHLILEQRNHLLDIVAAHAQKEKWEEAEKIYDQYLNLFCAEYQQGVCYPFLIRIERWNRITQTWNEELLCFTLCNILEELYEPEQGRAGIAQVSDKVYWITLMLEAKKVQVEVIDRKLEQFYEVVDRHLEFSFSLYADELDVADKGFRKNWSRLIRRAAANKDGKKGIYWKNPESGDVDNGVETDFDIQEDSIDQAITYIRKNVNRNISRAEVARLVHLNEEYFSRLFRQKTGVSFKEYVLSEKMKQACHLLTYSRFPVSIISSKVGYDNFSNFSRIFKKIIGLTPQEYRKEHQQ